MLGLVDYASDSDGDQEGLQQRQQQQQPPALPAAQAAVTAALPAPASRLPSATELLGDAGRGLAPTSRLPPPDFGSQPAPGRGGGGLPAAAATAGAKRAHPDTRGPLPNPMSLDSKLPRRWARVNVLVAVRIEVRGHGGPRVCTLQPLREWSHACSLGSATGCAAARGEGLSAIKNEAMRSALRA